MPMLMRIGQPTTTAVRPGSARRCVSSSHCSSSGQCFLCAVSSRVCSLVVSSTADGVRERASSVARDLTCRAAFVLRIKLFRGLYPRF